MFNVPPPEVLARLPPLYASESATPENILIHLHFFLGACDWYAAEFDGQDLFFGYACLGDPVNAEWGYFSFAELKSITAISRILSAGTGRLIARLPVQVDWDQFWMPKPFSQISRGVCRHA